MIEQYDTALREHLQMVRAQWVARSARTAPFIDALISDVATGAHTEATHVATQLLHAGWPWEQAQLPAVVLDLAMAYLRMHRGLAKAHLEMGSTSTHEQRSQQLILGDLSAVASFFLLSNLQTVPATRVVAAMQQLAMLLSQHTERALRAGDDAAAELPGARAATDAYIAVLVSAS